MQLGVLIAQSSSSASSSTAIVVALIALGATVIGGVIAVGWPTWRSWQMGRRFVRLIRRELEEIGPLVGPASPEGRPWWEYMSKRFVHEEFVSRDRITEHRDFVLSLDPTLVYQLAQLWISFDKRDGDQWCHYLGKLAENKSVATGKLTAAADAWVGIVKSSRVPAADSVRGSAGQLGHTPVERVPGLFEARLRAYRRLTPELTSQSMADEARRTALSGRLTVWLRMHGLLLSGESLNRFLSLRDLLRGEHDELPDEELDAALRAARSALRTELKIDLGVRHPDERDEPTDRIRRRA